MSTFRPFKKKCAVCGAEFKAKELTSTSEFGSPDLDLRPAELKRSTMYLWVQMCPKCGYAASDVEEKPAFDRSFLETESYRTCDGLRPENLKTLEFYRQYLCKLQEGKSFAAVNALLRSAWCCDDDGSAELAVLLRKKAADLLDRALPEAEEGDRETWLVLRADLLRRSGQFDKLLAEYDPEQFTEGILRDIISFQLRKAKEKDDAVYTVRDAVNEDDD